MEMAGGRPFLFIYHHHHSTNLAFPKTKRARTRHIQSAMSVGRGAFLPLPALQLPLTLHVHWNG